MEHHYVTADQPSSVRVVNIRHKTNSLDQADSTHELPEEPAVFVVTGRVNGQPANPRYVGRTLNLRETVEGLFDANQAAPADHDCFKQFMLSIKLKVLLYEPTAPELLDGKQAEWQQKFKPACNEVLNEIH